VILLLGGTQETRDVARALVEAGHAVLVSTAWEAPRGLLAGPGLFTRTGPLDLAAMVALIAARSITAIVDVAHPYAAEVHTVAKQGAARAGILYRAFRRPAALRAEDDVIRASTHEDAAAKAFTLGKAVLLTSGSRNIEPYAQLSRRTGLGLFVRILDHPASLAACHQAGLADENILRGLGPFDVDTNRDHIQRCGVGVLVTKDGGAPAGFRAKLEAAREEQCRVVVVLRPPLAAEDRFETLDAIVASLPTP